MSSQPQPPAPPNYAQQYQQGLQIFNRFLPTELRNEMMYRNLYDPQRIMEQQQLQGEFGPTQYSQQLQALDQLDPTGQLLRSSLGQQIQQMLQRGYVSPQQHGVYDLLARSVGGGLAAGTQADPATLRQFQQAAEARNAATGNSLGNAATMASLVYQGQRGQQLQLARQQAAQNFLGLQSPQAGALAQAGSFLSSPTPEQQLGYIQGVSPDRAFAYENPNAGNQAAAFGLANYGNQLGAFQAGGGATNPWMTALGGAGSGAISGALAGSIIPGVGTVAGAVGGGILGGLGGYFSDERLKQEITDTGRKTRDGIPIVQFRFRNGDPRRYEGVLAQDVVRVKPEAVTAYRGYLVVNYGALGVPLVEVQNGLVVS